MTTQTPLAGAGRRFRVFVCDASSRRQLGTHPDFEPLFIHLANDFLPRPSDGVEIKIPIEPLPLCQMRRDQTRKLHTGPREAELMALTRRSREEAEHPVDRIIVRHAEIQPVRTA